MRISANETKWGVTQRKSGLTSVHMEDMEVCSGQDTDRQAHSRQNAGPFKIEPRRSQVDFDFVIHYVLASLHSSRLILPVIIFHRSPPLPRAVHNLPAILGAKRGSSFVKRYGPGWMISARASLGFSSLAFYYSWLLLVKWSYETIPDSCLVSHCCIQIASFVREKKEDEAGRQNDDASVNLHSRC